jgi:HSP20 family protein
MADRWLRFQRFDPLRDLVDVQSELNRVFDSYFGQRARSSPAVEANWAPPIDAYETKDELVVTVELPGVKEKDVHLSIVGTVLTLRGQRAPDPAVRPESVHRVERWTGNFERQVELPVPVQPDKVRATYRDGVLEIHLPKVEEVKPREIKIQVG